MMIGNKIELVVHPALAKQGYFIVASAKTGHVLSVNGSFNQSEPTKYFADDMEAKRFAISLPQECRSFVFIN